MTSRGLLHYLWQIDLRLLDATRTYNHCERVGDERDLAFDAGSLVLDVAAFDGSDRFDAAQVCLGGSQGPKALTIPEQALHRGVIALDQVVSPLTIDMPNAVEVWIVSLIDLTDDAPVASYVPCRSRLSPACAAAHVRSLC